MANEREKKLKKKKKQSKYGVVAQNEWPVNRLDTNATVYTQHIACCFWRFFLVFFIIYYYFIAVPERTLVCMCNNGRPYSAYNISNTQDF